MVNNIVSKFNDGVFTQELALNALTGLSNELPPETIHNTTDTCLPNSTKENNGNGC